MIKKAIIFLLLSAPFITKAQTWEKINTGYNYILKGIEFPEGQGLIGYAGGQSVTYMGDAIVIKTTNGGTTWSSIFTGIDNGVEDISFPDMNTGYICGWSAYFAKTTNAGTTWTQQNPGTDIYYYTGVEFKDANHGVVTAQTSSSSGVWYTSNGGTTWNTGSGLASIPYKIEYVSDDTYFLVTNGGEIQKSVNGGATWTVVKSGAGLLLGIDFFNSQIGIATGEDGVIYKTIDGGNNWTTQIIPAGQPLWRDVAWKTQNEIVICGTPETIYRSTDGGESWVDDYPTSTYNPALYEVLFTNDNTAYICGSQGWFYRKAAPLAANFTADATTICFGSQVNFTDQSAGVPTGWNWTFEGGTPATSTLQNPTVTYSTPGTYDVTLTVTKGATTNTLVKPDYITVQTTVANAPTIPVGPAGVCTGNTEVYTTTTVANAASYNWQVTPVQAGTMSGTGTSANFTASNSWTGAATIKVAGSNTCGSGPFSPELSVTVGTSPSIYWVLPGGGYCEGSNGFEVKLEDSEIGVNYQLLKNGTAVGSMVAGTGNEISFGPQLSGEYTVTASSATCTTDMSGSATVFEIFYPEIPQQPTGPTEICAGQSEDYSSNLPVNGLSLTWSLVPSSAGTITTQSLTSVTIEWSAEFSGTATLTVSGVNECGSGSASAALNVNILAIPAPTVEGLNSVCNNSSHSYECQPIDGSSYQWTVVGGVITSGQGSSQIDVLWGAPAQGSVVVSETSAVECTGTSSTYEVTVNLCEGVEIPKETLKIYPNPVVDKLYFESQIQTTENDMLFISNASGQIVKSFALKNGAITHSVNTQDLPSGIYFLHSNNPNLKLNRSFIKQ